MTNQTLQGRGPLNIINKTADYTVLASETGSVFTNKGDTGAQVLQLPPAVVGLRYSFALQAAQEIRIEPDGTDKIALPSSGAYGVGGKYLVADAIGEYVSLACLEAGVWSCMGYIGTWTAEA